MRKSSSTGKPNELTSANKTGSSNKSANKTIPAAKSPTGKSQTLSESAVTLLPLFGIVHSKRTLPTQSSSRALIIVAATIALCFIKCCVLAGTIVPVHALMGPAYVLLTQIAAADDFGVLQPIFMMEQLMVVIPLLIVLAFLGPNTLMFVSFSALMFSAWFWYRRGTTLKLSTPKEQANSAHQQQATDDHGIANGSLPQPSSNTADLATEVALLVVSSFAASYSGWPNDGGSYATVSSSLYSNPLIWLLAVLYTGSLCIVFLLRENQALVAIRYPMVSYSMHALQFAGTVRRSNQLLNVACTIAHGLAQLVVPVLTLMALVLLDEREGMPILGCLILLVAACGCGLLQRFPPYSTSAGAQAPFPANTKIDAGQLVSALSASAPRIPAEGYVLYFTVFGIALIIGAYINPTLRSILLYNSISIAVIFTDIYTRRLQQAPIALRHPLAIALSFALTYIAAVYYVLLQKELFSPDSAFGPAAAKFRSQVAAQPRIINKAFGSTGPMAMSQLESIFSMLDENVGKATIAIGTMLYACFLTQGVLLCTYSFVKSCLTRIFEPQQESACHICSPKTTPLQAVVPNPVDTNTPVEALTQTTKGKLQRRPTVAKAATTDAPQVPATVAPIATTPLESLNGDLPPAASKVSSEPPTPNDEPHALSPTPTNDSIMTSVEEIVSREHGDWLRAEQVRTGQERLEIESVSEEAPAASHSDVGGSIPQAPTIQKPAESQTEKPVGKTQIIVNKNKILERPPPLPPAILPIPPAVLVGKKKAPQPLATVINEVGPKPMAKQVAKKILTVVPSAKPKPQPASAIGISTPMAATLAVTVSKAAPPTAKVPAKTIKTVDLPSLSDLVRGPTSPNESFNQARQQTARPAPHGPVSIDDESDFSDKQTPPPPSKPKDPFLAAFAPKAPLLASKLTTYAPIRPAGTVAPPTAIGIEDLEDGEEEGSSPTEMDRNWDEIVTPTATSNTSSNAFAAAIGGKATGGNLKTASQGRFGFGVTPITNSSVTSHNIPVLGGADSFSGLGSVADNGIGGGLENSRSVSRQPTACASAVCSPTRGLEGIVHHREESDPEAIGKLQHLMQLIDSATSPAPKQPNVQANWHVPEVSGVRRQPQAVLSLAEADDGEDLTDAKFLAKLTMANSGLMRSSSMVHSPQLRPPTSASSKYSQSYFTVTSDASSTEKESDPSHMASVNLSDFSVPAAPPAEADPAWDSLIRDLGIGDGTDGVSDPPVEDFDDVQGVVPTSQTVYYLMDHTGTQRPYVLGHYNGQPTYIPVAYQ